MKINYYLKKSLPRSFLFLLGGFIIFFVIGALILLFTFNQMNKTNLAERNELNKKQKIVQAIKDDCNQAFLDSRGYVAFGNNVLRDNALAQGPKVKKLEKQYKEIANSPDDKEFSKQISNFTDDYFNTILPKIINNYQSGNVSDILTLANGEATPKVQVFQKTVNDELRKQNISLENHYQKLISLETNVQIVFILIIFLVLVVLLYIMNYMFRKIGQPLSHIAAAANSEEERKRNQDITKEYEVDQIKSEFVSTVSHELRTPLSSILGFTELLLNRELKPERQKKYLTTIYNEAKRLTALINDFLDVQRMESGRQTYEKKYIPLLPMLNKIIETQQVTTNHYEIRLESDSEYPTILGDRAKIEQVFANLINNAVKYSPNGGLIKVRVTEEHQRVSVSVADQGLGIPEDAIPNLFQKFYRVDNSDRRSIGGTGLGLSIVQGIVKEHDGKVEVQSVFGKGSTFTVSFPCVQIVGIEAVSDNDHIIQVNCPSPLCKRLRKPEKKDRY
jgi:signal transduction histidine kinase